MQFLRIKNWHEFQHYRNRRPPWIKLHRQILDNYEFYRLQDASRALLPCLWLIASEYDSGEIPLDTAMLAFRLHTGQQKLESCLNELRDKGFIDFASNALAERKQDAIPEKSREEEEKSQRQSGQQTALTDFAIFWESYPRKVHKPAAQKAWLRAGVNGHLGDVLAALESWKASAQWQDPQYIPHPSTFINQRQWNDPVPQGARNAPTTGQRKTGITANAASRIFGVTRNVADNVQPALPSGDRGVSDARVQGKSKAV